MSYHDRPSLEERRRVRDALVRNNGNVSYTARELGNKPSRTTIRQWRSNGWLDNLDDGEKPRIRVKAVTTQDPLAEWRLPHKIQQPAYVSTDLREFVTAPDNTFEFGALGDSHLGSKYAREDVLESLFDLYAGLGITTVFHTGNWIDGEARFNVHDLHVRGLDAQCRYLAKVWPHRPGITTYAVAGDDHEGWYAQREGVDIGRYAERCFRDAGRDDWVDLGYMECPVVLRNHQTNVESIISIVHPGGGSAYALSYTIQKIVESLDGGEKPALGLYGHYHKLDFCNIRNVWCIQTGTTQDQTPFLRKKKIEAHVGGCVVKIEQDPETGALVGCRVDMRRYFNRGYYAGRWSHHGPVRMLERVPTGMAP